MCWSMEASWTVAAVGAAATVVALRRGEPPAIWGTVAYFAGMEVLQALGYGVADRCGDPVNTRLTQLSYLHIALQPLVINAFAMALAPRPVPPRLRAWVLGLAGLASAGLLLRLVPLPAFGTCPPGDVLCGLRWCLVSGAWHIAWEVPLNDLAAILGVPRLVQFPAYVAAVFVLPLVYGAWRFVLFNALAGPLLARTLAPDPHEWPAVWCLFSLGIVILSLSPAIRGRVLGTAAAGAEKVRPAGR